MKTWLNNKVLEIEERKDDEHKNRSFIIPGSFKPAPPTISPLAYSDDE